MTCGGQLGAGQLHSPHSSHSGQGIWIGHMPDEVLTVVLLDVVVEDRVVIIIEVVVVVGGR